MRIGRSIGAGGAAAVAVALLLGGIAAAKGDKAGAKVEELKKQLGDDADLDSRWIYADLDKALAQATKDGKPVLAVLRCPH